MVVRKHIKRFSNCALGHTKTPLSVQVAEVFAKSLSKSLGSHSEHVEVFARFFKKYFILIFLFTLISCDSNRLFEENKTIPDNVWDKNNKIPFEVDIRDTLTPHNFYINVRNADGYPYSNLFMFITTKFPNGKMSKDTLECILADDKGQWLGDGLGDIWDNQIPFKKNVRFPVKGKYIFELEQAMRVDQLPLIMDIGLRIEKREE